ncbi:MAG: ATP-binding cassette domain-containing protein [Blastocatellia bacterium]
MPLQVSKLSKRYGNNWVLRDVGFDVADGEIFGVFGESGSGKSTLLRCISGLEKMSGGSVTVSERASTASFPFAKKTSVWHRIFGGGGAYSADDLKREMEKSLAEKADVLLLDNPFLFLDVSERKRIFKNIKNSILQSGNCVIYATNNFDDVFAFCDRVGVLAGGYIQQQAIPQEIYESPASVAVARMVGLNNLIEARRLTSSKAEMPEFQTIDGAHRLFTQRIERGSLGALNRNVTLAIRPEHISISFGASFPEDNLLKASISGIAHRGATTIVELDAEGLKLKALVLRLVGLNIGDECMIGLPPERIMVLKD